MLWKGKKFLLHMQCFKMLKDQFISFICYYHRTINQLQLVLISYMCTLLYFDQMHDKNVGNYFKMHLHLLRSKVFVHSLFFLSGKLHLHLLRSKVFVHSLFFLSGKLHFFVLVLYYEVKYLSFL